MVLLMLLLLLPGGCLAFKLGLNRAEVLAMVGEQETRLYLDSCSQSSSHPFSCNFAIDTSVSLEPSQCALSDPMDDHWWIGTLETPAYITKVTLLSMDPAFKSFQDALTSMTILANEDVCIRHASTESSFTKWTFPCDSMAQVITIRSSLENSVMAICDIEVFGAPLKFPTILGENKPLKPPICQLSSVDGTGYCENAFDGDTSRSHQQKSCARSSLEDQPWIEARLARPAYVLEVKIYSAGGDGLNDLVILLDKSNYHEYTGPPFESMSFKRNMFGARLTVRSTLSLPLAICEIQVFGHEAKLVEVQKFKPLGCHKDNMFDRDMTQLVSSITMSPIKCHRMCKRLGLKHFALQSGYHCFCGNAYGRHGAADNKTCSIQCDGNPEEICGGEGVSSVFEIL